MIRFVDVVHGREVVKAVSQINKSLFNDFAALNTSVYNDAVVWQQSLNQRGFLDLVTLHIQGCKLLYVSNDCMISRKSRITSSTSLN